MPREFTLEPLPIIIFILFSYIWLGVVTNASSNFKDTINKTVANITNFDKRTLTSNSKAARVAECNAINIPISETLRDKLH